MGIGFRSRLQYWREKTGRMSPQADNPAMQQGRELENEVAWTYDCYMRARGRRMQRLSFGFKHLPGDARFGGSPDGIVRDLDSGEIYVLEIKTRYQKDELRGYIPVCHLVQMAGVAELFGLCKAHYICYTPNAGYEAALVEFAPDLWSAVIYPALRDFAVYVESDIAPPNMARGRKGFLEEEVERRCAITVL